MIFKRIPSIIAAVLLTVSLGTAAYAESLSVGGEAVGISISCDGVIVAGLTSVETENGSVSPSEEAGIEKGDVIVSVGDTRISGAEDFLRATAALDGSETSITVVRDGKERSLVITPARSADGSIKLGLWLRDEVNGVGTLTFYDPDSGLYGALGHGVSDSGSGKLVPLDSGSIYSAEIVDVKRGKSGSPGELCGESDEAKALGSIRINCVCGIFGTAELDCGEVMETGEAHCGTALIRCTVSGREVGEYEVEIVRLFRQDGRSCFQLSVCDDELLSLTGGIVQGMSGSPVIQDGRLVGAVTHVFVNDPTQGYGISIENMLKAAG